MKIKLISVISSFALGLFLLSGCFGNDEPPLHEGEFAEYLNFACENVERKEEEIYVQTVAEFKNAVANAGAGTTIIVKDGVYFDTELMVSNCGSRDAKIVIKAENVGGVILSGFTVVNIIGSFVEFDGFTFKNGAPGTNNGIFIIRGNFVRITNCEVDDYNYLQRKWVSVYGKFVEIDHNYFHGKKTIGALLTIWRDNQEPNFAYIHDNVFEDYQNTIGSDNELETIRIGTSDNSQSDSYSIVENNYFHNLNGEIEIISIKSGRNVLRGNTMIDCEGLFTTRHGKNNLIENNFISQYNTNPEDPTRVNDQGGGIRFYDGGHVIRNNYIEGVRTSSDSRAGLLVHSGNNPVDEVGVRLNAQWTPHDVLLEGNTVYDSRQSFIYDIKYGYDADNIQFKNNLVFSAIQEDWPVIRKGLKRTVANAVYEGELYFAPRLSTDDNVVDNTNAFTAPEEMTFTSIAAGADSATYGISKQGDIYVHADAGAKGVTRIDPADIGVDSARSTTAQEFDAQFFLSSFEDWPFEDREVGPCSIEFRIDLLETENDTVSEIEPTGVNNIIPGVHYYPTDNEFVDIENPVRTGSREETGSGSSAGTILRVKNNAKFDKGRITYMRFAVPLQELETATKISINITARLGTNPAGTVMPTTFYLLDTYENWTDGTISYFNTPKHEAETTRLDDYSKYNGKEIPMLDTGTMMLGSQGFDASLYTLDVTEFIKQTDGVFTFMLYDNIGVNANVDIYSKQRGNVAQRPFLSIEQ